MSGLPHTKAGPAAACQEGSFARWALLEVYYTKCQIISWSVVARADVETANVSMHMPEKCCDFGSEIRNFHLLGHAQFQLFCLP